LDRVISREVRIVSRPRAGRKQADFELVSIELPALQAGQMLVRNIYMSVDASRPDRFGNARSSMPAFRAGEPLEGSAVGKVVLSAVAGFAPGDAVTSMCGWREYFITDPSSVRRVDPRIQPLSAHLGVLGTSGLAAWAALHLADARAGEHVFVSAAAGPVGSIIGQLAKLARCYVVGAANSGESAGQLVSDLGFDAAFDDNSADLREELHAAFRDGIDVYFDNVGGAQLEIVLGAMREHGRIICCGALAAFDEREQLRRARSRELFAAKQLTMKCFLVSDWLGLAPVFRKAVSEHLLAGRLRVKEAVFDGIERAPRAFDALSRDETLGKVIIKLA
jgi:NADPH-dependent curcumin reductase CurA